MDQESLFQLIAFLFGGGAVSGGATYWYKRYGLMDPGRDGTSEAIANLKRSVDRLESSLGTRLDNIDKELRRAMEERHQLKLEVEILKTDH